MANTLLDVLTLCSKQYFIIKKILAENTKTVSEVKCVLRQVATMDQLRSDDAINFMMVREEKSKKSSIDNVKCFRRDEYD